jgi:pimeloyl-ACP methyl ester carboxylesterase
MNTIAVSRNNPTRRKVIALVIAGVLFLAYFVAASVLSRNKELNARHDPFSFAENFDYATGSFADYIAWSERRVRAAQQEGTDTGFVGNLLPFRLEPAADCPASATDRYRSGVVLTHDAMDSAYMLQVLGNYFQSRCFLVLGLLLPGHGSKPGELLSTRWEDWAAAEALAARELANEVEFPYLMGHGVGGTLAVLEASRNPQISGLILFAPRLDTRPSPWQGAAATALGWLLSSARWMETIPMETPYRYEASPWRLSGEINALVGATLAAVESRQVEVPVLMVASSDDPEASPEAMLSFMGERTHPLSHILLYGSNTFPAAPDRITLYPSGKLLESGTLGVSHRGLILPPYDRNFGRGGAIRRCGHYYWTDKTAYATCMEGRATVRGEITAENLQKGVLVGLQHNPFYVDIPPQLDKFLGAAARPPVILEI